MIIPRSTALTIVAMSLMVAGGPLAAIAQETAVSDNNDALQEYASSPTVPNNEQNSIANSTDVLESNDAVDVIASHLAQLSTLAPEVDIENSTSTEIGDLLEFYGLDTDGPACPPCP